MRNVINSINHKTKWMLIAFCLCIMLTACSKEETDTLTDPYADYVGTWKVSEFLFSSRVPVATNEPGREIIGKEFIIKKGYNIVFNNEDYYLCEVIAKDYETIAFEHNVIYAEVERVGTSFSDLGFIREKDGKTADFGLYINEDGEMFVWAGDWFVKNGLYSLTKVE